MLFFLNAPTADTISAVSLLKSQMLIHLSLILRSMVFFFKNWIGLDCLELGLEVTNGTAMRTAVGATTGVCEVVAIVLRFIPRSAPVRV